MSNHFHLVIRRPEGNLVYGMNWLQSTLANRYHHYRKVHRKLFQGRYKSLIVEEESYLGALLCASQSRVAGAKSELICAC
jgi:hypothetical protein